jgi:hypothetical protein
VDRRRRARLWLVALVVAQEVRRELARSVIVLLGLATCWNKNSLPVCVVTVRSWDYIQGDSTVVQDMDRTQAFTKGLQTWARWVDANLAQTSTKVFFQGYSPNHLE